MLNYDGPTKGGKGKKQLLLLDEIEDVSSESSDGDDESQEYLDQYLQECYYNSYLHYEQEARRSNHMVDVFNYNPNNLWQNIYLHN